MKYLQNVLALFDKTKKQYILSIAASNDNQVTSSLLIFALYRYNLLPIAMMQNISYDKFFNHLDIDITESENVDERDISVSAECCSIIDKLKVFGNLPKVAKSNKNKSNYYINYIGYIMLTDSNLRCNEALVNSMPKTTYQHILTTLKMLLSEIYNLPSNQALSIYGRFLTDPFDVSIASPCYGREKEISTIIDILSRKDKNNPILVGQPGVGKTAIVKGLANTLMSVNCPKQFAGYHIYELYISSIISGAMYRGDVEKRLTEILDIVTEDYNNIIVFIDEVHTIMSNSDSESGSSSTSGVPIADLLKPYMTGNGLKIIGATTEREYHKIEKDSALSRRFNVVHIKEPSIESVNKLVSSVLPNYEQHFGLTLDLNLVSEVVNYADRYIPNKYMPDKVLDLLDESFVQCKNHSNRDSVVIDDIISATELITNVKVPIVNNEAIQRVVDIMNAVRKHIIGQDTALLDVESILKRYFLGLRSVYKPIGSFLFVGPTGVGKTQLCKELAYNLFNRESFIRLDMSEYMEKHSISKLIGAPPGYVGYSTGGKLTEAVKHNPYSVILFDEIEKAHPDVYNILLQILDDGILTDSEGCKVNFTNTLIILTSNTGAKDVSEKFESIVGFGDISMTNKDKQRAYEKAVKKQFSPEFINRLDKVVYFNSLSDDNMRQIVDMQLEQLIDKLLNINISVSVAEEVKNYLYDKCIKSEYGARYVHRMIDTEVEDLIINYLLSNSLLGGKNYIELRVNNGLLICDRVKELVA